VEIEQFLYASDNLGYLVYTETRGIAIDGGDPQTIIEFAKNRGIEIVSVTNTHSHADHTLGNAVLLEKTNAVFMDCRTLEQGQVLDLGQGEGLEVILTPGHTTDSVCFKGDKFIVTGDTLFNGTVGNCFSGDLEAFYRSLKQLMGLPGKTLVYSGHDYVMDSLKYAGIIEPGNPDLDAYKQAYNKNHIVSSLADELKVNPYIRFNAPSMIQQLKEKGLPRDTESQRFSSIMEIY
jgi:hydroxyacylglutathione hydrolase